MVNFIVNLTMILWAVSLFWLARESFFTMKDTPMRCSLRWWRYE